MASMKIYFNKVRRGTRTSAAACEDYCARFPWGAAPVIGTHSSPTCRPPAACAAGLSSFGASCVLLFSFPDNPFSQPRNVIGGHFISSLTGLVFLAVFGSAWWSMAHVFNNADGNVRYPKYWF